MPDTILRTLIIVTHLIFTVDLQSRYHYLLLLISALYGWENRGSERLSRPRSCCCCSVTKSCLTLCDSMDCSTPGSPVLHYLPEFAQIQVHWVSDVIQSSHLLSSPSLPAFNLSQHQGLFQWVGYLHQVAKALELQLQPSALSMNVQCWFPLGLTVLTSLLSKGLSRVFSSTTVQKHQFFSTQPSLWSNSHIHTGLLEKP